MAATLPCLIIVTLKISNRYGFVVPRYWNFSRYVLSGTLPYVSVNGKSWTLGLVWYPSYQYHLALPPSRWWRKDWLHNFALIYFSRIHVYYMWAASWQNQQTDCVPREDSDQPEHPPSLIRVFAVLSMGSKGPKFLHADSEDSDQTGRMPRLILVFAGRTCDFVGFVMRRLMCLVQLVCSSSWCSW